MQTFLHNTWLQDEAVAYPTGGQRRRGRAIFPDGRFRAVYAGIPDTFFSIPAHGRIAGVYVSGWVGIDDRMFECPRCHVANWHNCTLCEYGLVASPTRGALLFHPRQRLTAAA